MERKLLLLGMLRGQEMHGYRLTEIFEKEIPVGITLKKSNAYQLLKKMKDDGWVTSREEREGNRPPRQVYSITKAGKGAFERLLRDSLADYPSMEIPSSIALNYLSLLSPDESISLLEKRREKVEAVFKKLKAVLSEVREEHPGIEHVFQHNSLELKRLDSLIKNLSSKKKKR